MLYTSSAFDNVAPEGYYSDGVVWWQVNEAGVITATGSCPAPTPTPSPPQHYTYDFCFNEVALTACGYGSHYLYYSDESELVVNSRLYTDTYLSSPAPDGYYSDGSIVYQITSGVVASIESCT
jgi:hypothetical protein